MLNLLIKQQRMKVKNIIYISFILLVGLSIHSCGGPKELVPIKTNKDNTRKYKIPDPTRLDDKENAIYQSILQEYRENTNQ